MTDHIVDRLRRITTSVETDAEGTPRVAPASVDEMVQVIGLGADHGWRVRVEGAGSWTVPDAPADVAITTKRMNRIVAVSPSDLVATAQGGITMDELARSLAAHRAWLAVDPPGGPDRTLGSVVATATAGPLRHSMGPIRDHILGVTVVTGHGQVIRSGGQVVKNVAGYDLTKLAVGGFGAFGIIVEASLRLRALPQADVTLLARGPLDPLLDAGIAITKHRLELAALELVSPGLTGARAWTLLIRLLGTDVGVAATIEHIARVTTNLALERLEASAARGAAQVVARGANDAPVSLRLAALPDSLPDTLELLGDSLDLGRVTAGLGRGGVRWSGSTNATAIAELRQRLAAREIPLTVERAPWLILRECGHFGAYREGVAALTSRLRQVFDPKGAFVVPLEAESGG